MEQIAVNGRHHGQPQHAVQRTNFAKNEPGHGRSHMSNSKDAVRMVLDQVKADNRTSLTAPEGKLVCAAYGIPVPKVGVAMLAGETGKMASSMGFPVVMKLVSPDILHTTEAGGVIVG